MTTTLSSFVPEPRYLGLERLTALHEVLHSGVEVAGDGVVGLGDVEHDAGRVGDPIGLTQLLLQELTHLSLVVGNVPSVTPRQAQYILEKLIDDRTVNAADVRRHLAGMWQEMNALEKRIAELRGLAASVHPVRRAKEVVKRVVKRVRRKTAWPEVAASRKLQGQYIAAIRQLPKSQRKRFATIAKTDSREAAITAIKKQLGK